MFEVRVRNRRWRLLFTTVCLLIFCQIIWWMAIFVEHVDKIAQLRRENLVLSMEAHHPPPHETLDSIQKEVFHRRLMFFSESVFFMLLTGLGHYLLYRALRVDHVARETQKNFIEVVSHESKTPLTALKLRLEALKETRSQDPTVEQELTLALSEVRRLSQLMDRVLTLNRLERHAFHFEKVYLADLAEEVVSRLEPFLRDKKVQLNIEMDPDVAVVGDAAGLQNTIQSLLENAVLYNDKEHKEVSLKISVESGKGRVEISDNGPGVHPQERERVFEKFYRSEKNFRTPGSGLGLFIAKSIIEAHQGVIRLVSSQNGGSRFEIELPQARPA